MDDLRVMSNLKEDLQKCDTLLEMMEAMNRHYKCDGKLGPLYKNVVIMSLPRMVMMAGLKKR